MYENLTGKKLLVLGSEERDASIVKTAQKMGIYVIAADGIPTSNKTIAKMAADESWDIDYRDTDAYVKKCLEEHVDGVIAGYSENRVLAACRIANRINSPFYATEEQIDITRNKRKFKQLCTKNGVRVPKEFSTNGIPTEDELKQVQLPVIVKPADSAGRKGITICSSFSELKPAVEKAIKESLTGTVVVEEYVTGTEFAAVYTLQDGKYSLSYFCDKYLNTVLPKQGLCDLSFAPSVYLDGFMAECHEPLCNMMRDARMENGVAFYQGIANKNGFYVFEMGYRINGGSDCIQIERYNGVNYMKMLISHSLCGSMVGDLSKDNAKFPVNYGVFYLYAKSGEIAEIEYTGDESIKEIEEVGIYKTPGTVVKNDGTTQQCVFRFRISAPSMDRFCELINYAQDHARIIDTDGNDMLLSRFDTARIKRSV